MILDVKQLNKTMKLHYFCTLKALRDGRVKLRCIMGCPGVKKQLSGKRSFVILLVYILCQIN